MTVISPALLIECAPKCDAATLAPALDQAARDRLINTPLRVAHFLAQVHVETAGLTRFEENLNYSAVRLMQVWPSRFKTPTAAIPYAHEPIKLANLVYAKRMGNTQPGDGWKYRGRGAGLTGRENYESIGHLIGEDLVGDPDLVLKPYVMAAAAACFFQSRGCNTLADDDDIAGVTEIWNGGLIGLPDRKTALAAYKHALGVPA